MTKYEIIHEAGTSINSKATVFYVYNQEKRKAKAIILTPPGMPLRNFNGRALEAVLFNVDDFNKKDIISRLNYKLEKIGVIVNDRTKNSRFQNI